ncbi:MAG: UDP-glucose 4-epimerase GalE [Spirochaetaceae bacterium]
MKVVLCGGAGYIGSHVAHAFLERGYEVGVYDNLSTGLAENIPPGASFYKGDIADGERLEAVLSEGWDGVVHLAAFKAAGESMLEPEKYALNNICGSLTLIDAAVKTRVRGFVLSSSAAVYGEPKYLPVDESHPTNPENYYGFTKLEIERNLQWFDTLRGLRSASLRYFNAAGYDPENRVGGLEKNPANLIPVVMETAAGLREKVSIFGSNYPTPDGTGVRDYVHVNDLAEAHVTSLEYIIRNDTSLTVNLGSESGLSVLQILESARRISGREIPAEFQDRREGDPAKLVASSAKAQKLLGWKSRYSDLDTIIKTTWEAYRNQKNKRKTNGDRR